MLTLLMLLLIFCAGDYCRCRDCNRRNNSTDRIGGNGVYLNRRDCY